MLSTIRTCRHGLKNYPQYLKHRRPLTTQPPPPSERIPVSKSQRASLRKARKERAAAAISETTAATPTKSSSMVTASPLGTKMIWYVGLGVPTAVLAWGILDEDSPPAKLAEMVGLKGGVESIADKFARPSREKLIPDWSQMPNVPHDIPVIPPTLVLDLENTLVSSTWDRKYGWRHAKRPGVDRFLTTMAQYYEIILYTPSHEGVAQPVLDSLDKYGSIMHRLYRDATYYKNGIHMKDLTKLNRNMGRMIVLDDDPEQVSNPENLIRVKAYTDPADREDRTLENISPLLIEIAREGYDDIPTFLSQFRGMDADQIADRYRDRIEGLHLEREEQRRRGLGRFIPKFDRPEPEAAPQETEDVFVPPGQVQQPGQLTSKDLVGAAPPSEEEGNNAISWLNKRQKEHQEEQMRKMEKWNEVMMKRQMEKKKKEEQAAVH